MKRLTLFFLNIQEHIMFKKKIKEMLRLKIENGDDNYESKYGMIYDALKATIPMEVEEYEDDDGNDEEGRPIIRRFCGCPRCHTNIYSNYYRYCIRCGQRLRW